MVPSVAVTVPVSFKTTAAVEAAAIDCAVVTQDACAESTISAGKKAANIRTDNAANRRIFLMTDLLL